MVANDIAKLLCLRMFPEVSGISHLIEVSNVIEPVRIKQTNSSSADWEQLERKHQVYAFLARGLSSTVTSCISEAISASSTDNYPDETVQNTLESIDRVQIRPSYWSSKGETDPTIPETLVYKLISKLCIITEINVHPFRG